MTRFFSFFKDTIINNFSSVATMGVIDYVKYTLIGILVASSIGFCTAWRLAKKDLEIANFKIDAMTSYVSVLKEENKKEVLKENKIIQTSLKEYIKTSTKQEESLILLKDIFERKQNELALSLKQKQICEEKVILFLKSKDEKDEIKIVNN